MIFTVEDGTGIADATSYVDVAYAEDYLGTDWVATVEAQQDALIRGSEYADARWGVRLKSVPLTSEQGLEIPRYAMFDRYGILVEGVPNDWKKAICLYAKAQAVNGSLYPTTPTSTSKEVLGKTTKVGPITTSVTYRDAGTAGSWLQYPLADKLAKKFINASAGVERN